MRDLAESWMREVLGAGARFRDGQWEAIEALVEKRQRVLVVQRTGWGKSMVYFLATRLLREQGKGTTVLISPLLSLMRNQIQAAAEWGLRAKTINSALSAEENALVERDLKAGNVDLLLISPERLSNDRFQAEMWPRLSRNVGLLVVDEAHCISDWGHDFRPNYRRIMYVLDDLPAGTPVLGTTATANNRVVKDVSDILGAGMNIQRGPLTRDSLHLYVYPQPYDHAYRLTLLAHLLKSIEGSGIIYCTTTRDCQIVADWLQAQGFNVRAYYAAVEEDEDASRVALENQLMRNELKALVASVALGMGFDKPDLHFVIHYQQPGNIISYYQQIGRAGRGIDRAHIILMHGAGDEDIQRHFIETAFPLPEQIEATITALAEQGDMTRNALQRWVNASFSMLEKVLTHLEVEKIIEKRAGDYHLLNRTIRPDYERWEQVTRQRYAELEQMRAYIHHDGCLMRFIADALDDPTTVEPCGQCKNCRKTQSNFQADPRDLEVSRLFLRQGRPITLEARKRWPSGYPHVKKLVIQHVNEEGIALCNYYDSGWAELVRQGRQSNHFADDLIAPSVDLLRSYFQTLKKAPVWVTSVPSLRRPQLVSDFAARLAAALGLPYHDVVVHVRQHPEQSTMRNSYQQAMNVREAFAVQGKVMAQPVLLIDDLADSRWTLTMIGALLQTHGSGAVYPFVLASSSST